MKSHVSGIGSWAEWRYDQGRRDFYSGVIGGGCIEVVVSLHGLKARFSPFYFICNIWGILYVTSDITYKIYIYIYKKVCELQSMTIKWRALNLPANLGTRTLPILRPCLCAPLPFHPCLPTQVSHCLESHEVYSLAFVFFFFESLCRTPVSSLESS